MFGKFSNLSTPIRSRTSDRRGRACIASHVGVGRLGTLAYNSFSWRAIRMFNQLPLFLRNTTVVVSHHKLTNKISNIGIQGKHLLWISDFLSHRRQRVMCNGVCSNWSEVTSGIPQGSVLGPLLFTIFINDLPLSITSHIQIFADDTKIYNTVQDSGILKNDLDKLVLWSKEWLLPFNIDKCNILHFGKNNPQHLI